MFLFTNPYEIEFSVWVGVGGCGCPIFSKVLCTGTEYFSLFKSAPNLYLAADDMNNFIMCEIFNTAPFLDGKFALIKIK